MSFKKFLGTVAGGAVGFLVGGPAGALKGASLGAGVDAARMQSSAAKEAAATTASAADRSSDLQREMFERNIQLQEPFRQAGITALNKLTPLATEYTPFGMQQFQADPGYAFRLSEGQKQLDRMAAIRGGQISGSSLKAAARFGQDMGSQEYQNAFKRYQTEREARLAPLQSLAGVGQTTANTLGQAGTGFANRMGDIDMNQSQIAAQAGMSRASTYGNTLNQLAYLGGRYMDGGAGGAGGGGGGSNALTIGYQDPYAAFRYGDRT
jgi:hypothetical protein